MWDDRWSLTVQSVIAVMNIMGGKVQMTAKRASPIENGVTGGIIDGQSERIPINLNYLKN